MMNLRNFILTFFGQLVLTQCNTKQDTSSTTQILSSSTNAQPENKLIGEWKYKNTIWYSSELTLQGDGTFKFHDQSCYGQMFSQGQWTNINGIIQLTSFGTFKLKEQNKKIKLTEVPDQKKIKHKLKKGEIKYSFVGFKDVSSPILPGPNDTVRIYLNRIQLQLINDTLYCVGSDKLPEGTKFYRTKNKGKS